MPARKTVKRRRVTAQPADTSEIREEISVKERTPRFVETPSDAIPADDTKHTRWVREDKKRIRDMELLGYRVADTDDVDDSCGGVKLEDGAIHKGDLILMITNRSEVEEREVQRLRELENMETGLQDDFDKNNFAYTKNKENYRVSRGKKYFIP